MPNHVDVPEEERRFKLFKAVEEKDREIERLETRVEELSADVRDAAYDASDARASHADNLRQAVQAERERLLSAEAIFAAAKRNQPFWSALKLGEKNRLLGEAELSIRAALADQEGDTDDEEIADPSACPECGGSQKIATGECRESMSGPTCMNADCPPCQAPETEPCPACCPPVRPHRGGPKG